jgi:hypothetical protein
MLISFGDRLQPGGYRLHSRFSRALNYANEEHLVSLVTKQVGAGPTNIVLTDIHWIQASDLEVTSDEVLIGDQPMPLPPDRRYHSGLDFTGAKLSRSLQHLRTVRNFLLESSPPLSLAFLLKEARNSHLVSAFHRQLVKRVNEAWEYLLRLQVDEGVRLMLGAGYGLTPSGDDFVAGWMTGLDLLTRLFHRPVAKEIGLVSRQLKGGNPISRNLFWCTLRRRYVKRIRDLLQAIGRASCSEVEQCARDVLRIGETSGADFSTGLVACLSLHGVLGHRHDEPVELSVMK